MLHDEDVRSSPGPPDTGNTQAAGPDLSQTCGRIAELQSRLVMLEASSRSQRGLIEEQQAQLHRYRDTETQTCTSQNQIRKRSAAARRLQGATRGYSSRGAVHGAYENLLVTSAQTLQGMVRGSHAKGLLRQEQTQPNDQQQRPDSSPTQAQARKVRSQQILARIAHVCDEGSSAPIVTMWDQALIKLNNGMRVLFEAAVVPGSRMEVVRNPSILETSRRRISAACSELKTAESEIRKINDQLLRSLQKLSVGQTTDAVSRISSTSQGSATCCRRYRKLLLAQTQKSAMHSLRTCARTTNKWSAS